MDYIVTFTVLGKKFRTKVSSKDASDVRDKIKAYVMKNTELNLIQPDSNEELPDFFKQFFR
jgi:hypothetical protein